MLKKKEKKGKNIWLFNQYAITPDLPGGSRHYDISRQLVARGYRVTIFASAFSHSSYKNLKCAKNEDFTIEIKNGVHFEGVKTIPYIKNNWKRVLNMISYSRMCLKIYKKLTKMHILEKPDVIIGSAVHLFAVWTAFWISRKFKANFVMEVRDLWPKTLVEFRKILKYHPIVLFFGILERFLAKRAERIVSVLPKAFAYYRRFGIAKEKVIWIPNGVDTTLYLSYYDDSVQPKKSEYFKVIYSGILGMEANLQTLLEAAKLIMDKNLPIYFEIVGNGEKRTELIRMKEKLGLENVSFKEPIEKKHIPALLFKANALWIGTRNVKNLYKYGFSFNKLFEYLASGKPVLFSINSTYNPVEQAGAGLTVSPEDPVALSKAITSLYEMSDDESLAMGKRGFEYVKKYHDIQKLTDQFEHMLIHIKKREQKEQD